MPIDPNIALQVQPPKFDSPVNMLTQVMQMQGLRDQNSLNALKMQEYQREGEERNAFRNALSADFDPSNPGQVNALMRASPKMATDYLKSVYERQKTQAEIEKSRAETRDRGLKTLGLALSSTLEDPSDNRLRRAFDSLDAVGIDTQKIRTHFAGVPDVEARRQLIRGFAFNSPEGKAAIEFVQPKWEKQTDNQKTWFVDTNPNSRTFGTKRDEFQMQATPGEVMTDARTREEGNKNREVQIRGQNMTDARVRDANSIASGNRQGNQEGDLRKEFEGLPEVKNYKLAFPSFEIVRDASTRNNPQSDINLIYGIAKLYDPTSVVREGEYNTIANSQAIPDWVKGQAQRLAGGGKLAANTKAQLVAEAEARIKALENQYKKAQNSYQGIAQRSGLRPEQIFTEVGQVAAPSSQSDDALRKAIDAELKRRGVK